MLPIQILDRKSVQPQGLGLVHPPAHGRQRNLQELRVEPGFGLLPAGEQNLDLLSLRVDAVVALILVVAQRREIPDAIGQLSQGFGQPEGIEQPAGTLGKRALQRRVFVDAGLQAFVARFPLFPGGEDVGEVPLVAIGDVVAPAAARCRGLEQPRHRPGRREERRRRMNWLMKTIPSDHYKSSVRVMYTSRRGTSAHATPPISSAQPSDRAIQEGRVADDGPIPSKKLRSEHAGKQRKK